MSLKEWNDIHESLTGRFQPLKWLVLLDPLKWIVSNNLKLEAYKCFLPSSLLIRKTLEKENVLFSSQFILNPIFEYIFD